MDISNIKKLYEVIEKNTSANTIKVSYKKFKAKIVRGNSPSPFNSPNENNEEIKQLQQSTKQHSSKKRILSKYIGFFSRFDPKTKKHCTKLRDVVKKGQVVAYVRSMHLTMPIVADHGGKITHFLVEEKQPVEYNQPVANLE